MERDNEINSLILEHFPNLEKDFILLHGAPGVGKTKLAIQAISEYCKDNLEFHVFCISYKGGELLTDLTCNIDLNNDNIIFVDDDKSELPRT